MNGSDDNNQSYTAEPDVTIFDLRHTISTIPTGTVTNSVDSVSGISISKNDVRTSGDGTTVTPTVVLIPDPVSTVVDVTDTEDTVVDETLTVLPTDDAITDGNSSFQIDLRSLLPNDAGWDNQSAAADMRSPL
eukprot:TRINITY_DN5456_c0_g1_i29.p1 TRINITY_DN5456_c0_g1~~TRINITY_DN5456_c0_g1_i29.p1  ORF type:complete len:133 (+),score=21.86 TRINITY_DN5456_c0_g1_i29:1136-1534(+)